MVNVAVNMALSVENFQSTSIDLKGKTTFFIDLDGTIADSLPLLFPIYMQFLERHGVKGSVEEFNFLNGPPLNEIVAFLKQQHDLTDGIKTLCEHYLGLIKDRYLDSVKMFEGSLSFLQLAKQKGFDLYLLTSNHHEVCEGFLQQHRVKQYFTQLFCQDQASFVKTEPAYYQHICKKLGKKSQEIIVIEDSLRSIQAAANAGLKTLYFNHRNSENIPSGTDVFYSWPELCHLLMKI